VCHGPTLTLDGRRVPLRVHGLLDDASRYVVALRVASDEREHTMLTLFAQALMAHGKCDALYLDNGATYRGAVLQLCCSRLGITLLHAKPYDAPARGKMERFWRRMREEALSHLGQVASLADAEQKLNTWLVRYYQGAPHAGLLGRDPATCFSEAEKVRVTEQELREALTVRQRRRVRRDSTLSLGGTVYEVPLGYLAGQIVTVATSLFDGAAPVVELDDKRIPLSVVDPLANGKKGRPRRRPGHEPAAAPVVFDPGRTLSIGSEEDGDDHPF
jgi:hypothetical protein